MYIKKSFYIHFYLIMRKHIEPQLDGFVLEHRETCHLIPIWGPFYHCGSPKVVYENDKSLLGMFQGFGLTTWFPQKKTWNRYPLIMKYSYWRWRLIAELPTRHVDFPWPCWFARGYMNRLKPLRFPQVPDATFVEMFPQPVVFPRHVASEWETRRNSLLWLEDFTWKLWFPVSFKKTVQWCSDCVFQPLVSRWLSGWWFGTFDIFPYIGNHHPNWLIFFRGVETTNQIVISKIFPGSKSKTLCS